MGESKQFVIDDELLASQGQRISNWLVDYIIQLILMFGLFFIGAIIAVGMGYQLEEIADSPQRLSKVGQYALGLVIMLVYYNFFEILFAVTVGKLVTGTVVVDEFGEKPTANDILLRSICRAIPLEFLTFLGTPSVGWHDRFSQTYVVRKSLLESKKRMFHSFGEIGENPENQPEN